MKKIIFILTLIITGTNLYAQNVGIGTNTPDYRLDVSGTIRGDSNLYVNLALGVGTTSPLYKMQVNNGQIALYNTTDLKAWLLNYNSSSNYFSIMESGTSRLVIANGGNVGIGTLTPANKLDVVGNIHTTGTIDVDGSATIDGNTTMNANATVNGNAIVDGTLTVNNGKGVAYNPNAATNLKIYTFTTPKFTAILGGHQLSGEGTLGFGGGFTNPPMVFVGSVALTGGASGELYRVQLVLYDCTNNSCKARLLNTSPNSVNYDIYWNIVCIGN